MAIVLLEARPAIDVVDGTFQAPEEAWAHLNDPEIRPRLEAAIRAVGRVENEGTDYPFLGTAFAVGEDLFLTFTGAPGPSTTPLFVGLDDGIRIPVSERIPLPDPLGDWELVRLPLPNRLEPLQLPALPPETLVGRDVVAIGYPSSDSRNDPAAMQQVFRGVLGAKRLLPGRVTGLDEEGTLRHDCSTTGGCAGAPLIDVQTGEVVGIHYAGQYLKCNLAMPVAGFLPHLTAALDVAPPTPGFASPAGPALGEAGEIDRPAAGRAAAPDDEAVPERGPLPAARPAVAARGWWDALQADWRQVLEPHAPRVETAVRAVGRVLNGTTAAGWNGTAFRVGDRLVLTASFVAQTFAEGSGRQVTIRDGCSPGVDFCDALGTEPGSATAAVTGVRFIHPYFHVALLELDRIPEGVTQLRLAARVPADLSGRPVVLVTYGPPGALLVQPGQARQVGELPDDSKLPVLAHDCANEPGSAGGPVVDVGTGYVIGLHSHGLTAEDGGFAQPPWELARDPFLWDEALDFWPDPRPPWLNRWEIAGASPARVRLPPAGPPERWTVDKIPIDWTLKEPRDLRDLLVATIDAEVAVFHAENVGLPLGFVSHGNAPQLLWRDLLKAAALKGILRRFVEYLASLPEYDGIEPQLRTYL